MFSGDAVYRVYRVGIPTAIRRQIVSDTSNGTPYYNGERLGKVSVVKRYSVNSSGRYELSGVHVDDESTTQPTHTRIAQ